MRVSFIHSQRPVAILRGGGGGGPGGARIPPVHSSTGRSSSPITGVWCVLVCTGGGTNCDAQRSSNFLHVADFAN